MTLVKRFFCTFFQFYSQKSKKMVKISEFYENVRILVKKIRIFLVDGGWGLGVRVGKICVFTNRTPLFRSKKSAHQPANRNAHESIINLGVTLYQEILDRKMWKSVWNWQYFGNERSFLIKRTKQRVMRAIYF